MLPIKNNVVFPGVLLPIAVSKKSSLKLIKAAEKDNRPLLLLTQKDGKVTKEPKELLAEDQLYTLGVLARVIQIVPVPEMGKGPTTNTSASLTPAVRSAFLYMLTVQ